MKNIQEYVMKCTNLLIDELVKENVVKVANKSEGSTHRKYRFTDIDKTSRSSREGSANTLPSIVQDFYDFRNILPNIVYKLEPLSNELGLKPSLNEVVDKFIELKVIDPPWKNVKIVRDFFDKAEDILTGEESRKSALQTLKRNKVSFNPLIMKVLEYFGEIILEKVFYEAFIINPRLNEQKLIRYTPDFIVNVPESNSHILVDMKFRKGKISLKEITDQAIEKIRVFEDSGRQKYKCLVIVYTFGLLQELERDVFNFKESMERRPSIKDKIFFIPIGINNLENLSTYLTSIKNDILERQEINFTFSNQAPPKGLPEIDDHYYSHPFNLSRNNLEIRMIAKRTGHWRFGIKFSNHESFPEREERHPFGYPLIHLQKESESDKLSITCYDEYRHSILYQTSIKEYRNETLIIKVYGQGEEIMVDFLDFRRQTIIDTPFSLAGYNYCWISAWADGRNPFEFETEIIEYLRE